MKTLIINGSPRKNGDTVTLLNEIKPMLEGEILEVSAYYDKISPCIDCRYCWQKGECCLKDKMSLIYDDDFDNVIIASPIYISGLPGPMISLASRLQVYYIKKNILKADNELHRKNGGLILVGGGDGSSKRARSYTEWIFEELNATLDDENIVYSLNTNRLPASQDEKAKARVKQLALKLNHPVKEQV